MSTMMCRFLAVLLALGMLGCGGGKQPSDQDKGQTASASEKTPAGPDTAKKPEPPAPRGSVRSEKWFSTPEELAQAVLQALRDRDSKALHALRVSGKLYKEELCPAFLATKPRHSMGVDFHWQLLQVNCVRAVREIIEEYGGLDFEFLGLQEPEKIEDYSTFRLWRRVRVKVRIRGQEKIHAIRVFGAIVERDGLYTLLAYVS
jgi:hypothetical protein